MENTVSWAWKCMQNSHGLPVFYVCIMHTYVNVLAGSSIRPTWHHPGQHASWSTQIDMLTVEHDTSWYVICVFVRARVGVFVFRVQNTRRDGCAQLGWCPKASLISWAIIFMLLDSLVIFALHLPIYFPPFFLAILAFLAFTLYGMLCLSLYVRPIAWFMAPSIAPLLSHCGRTVWCADHNAPKLHCWVYCIAGAIDAGLRQGQRSWVLLTHWRRDQRQRNRMLRKHVRTWLWRRILWGQRDGECCIAT